MPFAGIEGLHYVGGIDLPAIVAQIGGVASDEFANFHGTADRVFHFQPRHQSLAFVLHNFQADSGGVAHHYLVVGEFCRRYHCLIVGGTHSDRGERREKANDEICDDVPVHSIFTRKK